jgi:hypothetical protein
VVSTIHGQNQAAAGQPGNSGRRGKITRQGELYRPFANATTVCVSFPVSKTMSVNYPQGAAMKPSPFFEQPRGRHRFGRRIAGGVLAAAAILVATECQAQQVIYYSPVVAAPVVTAAPAYVANYTPSGNYAAVTAYSPPVVAAAPTSSVAVTSYYAPAVTSYYAPTVATPAVNTVYYAAAPPVIAPVTTYYAPAAVAVPLYRRGLFGRYRPAGTALVPAY